MKRELRKLHLRWWHASSTSMTRVLKAAGVPQKVLEMVPDVISSCRECRAWQRPGPATQPSLRLTVKFNQHVEYDLMFYKSYIIFHLICRGSRWHAGVEVPGKHEETLFEAYQVHWYQIFGPPEELIGDGEGGL